MSGTTPTRGPIRFTAAFSDNGGSSVVASRGQPLRPLTQLVRILPRCWPDPSLWNQTLPETRGSSLPRDREVLSSWSRSPSCARVGRSEPDRVLAGDGVGINEIVRRVGVSKPTVIAWKRRYAAEGIGGLTGRPKLLGHCLPGKRTSFTRHWPDPVFQWGP